MSAPQQTDQIGGSMNQSTLPEGRSFSEGKTVVWLIGGFILCRYLTEKLLPSVGFKEQARVLTPSFDAVAPYLLLPVCLVLIIQVWRHSALASAAVAVGSLALDYFFFVRFADPPSWLALGLIVLGVAGSYAAYRSRRGTGSTSVTDDARSRRMLVRCIVLYGVCAVATAIAQRALTDNGASETLSKALPIVPTAITLAAYVAFQLSHRRTLLWGTATRDAVSS